MSLPNLPSPTNANVFHLDGYLETYHRLVEKFGHQARIEPGRMELLGWDLEYVCGAALKNFVDQILVRRLDDFTPTRPAPVILDCGANIGFTVLNYKRQFPSARIIAFEPDPQFAPVLRRNLEHNGAVDVQVVEAAVWVQNGEITWFSEGIDGSKIVTEAVAEGNLVQVATIDLAEYITSEIDLIKLDIEGAEYQVIQHLVKQGKLHLVHNMIIECHTLPSDIRQLGAMLELLASAGFQLGVNSMGKWRDLVRQPEIPPNHYGQYFTVAAWRAPIPDDSSVDGFLTLGGVPFLLEKKRGTEKLEFDLRTRSEELAETQHTLDLTRAELARYTRLGKPFRGAIRLINLILDWWQKPQS